VRRRIGCTSHREKINNHGTEERPGTECREKEVKIARILIAISVIFGLAQVFREVTAYHPVDGASV